MYADLHMHTTHSDGTDTPREILKQAKKAKLSVIAITDHDCITGSVDAMKYADDYNIKIIPAIELTTMHEGELAHVLGYNIDFSNKDLLTYIDNSTSNMTETTRLNFEKSKSDGIHDYSWERVQDLFKNRSYIGGTSVLKSMKADNISPTVSFREFFMQYFHPMGSRHIKHIINAPFEAIDIILAAGGVPVLAHPKLIGNDNAVKMLLEYGAMGLEAYHPTNNKEDEERYKAIANEHNAKITGGTDWHGKNSAPYITHFGMRGLAHDNYIQLDID